MHLRMPFAYSVYHCAPGERKRASRTLIDFVEREVPEIASSEMATAATWNQKIAAHARPIEARVGLYEGHFYEDILQGWRGLAIAGATTRDRAENTDDTFGRKAAMYSGEFSGRIHSAIRKFLETGVRQSPPKPTEVGFDLGDDQEERRLAAQGRIDGLLLVDGRAWKRVHEPTLVARSINPYTDTARTVRFVMTEPPRLSTVGVAGDGMAFRMDEQEQWGEYLARGCGNTVLQGADEIKVILPSAFDFDNAHNVMVRASELFLSLFGPQIHTWKTEDVSSFVAIRSKMDSHISNPEMFRIEQVIDDIVTLLPRIDRRTDRYHDVYSACMAASEEESRIDFDISPMMIA